METENRTDINPVVGASDGTHRTDEPAHNTDTIAVSDADRRKSRRAKREFIPIRGPLWNGGNAEAAKGASQAPQLRKKKKRLTKHDKAEQFALGLLSKMEKSLTNMLGDDCSMDEFERTLVEPSLTSIFESTDTEMLDRFTGILTPAALLFGMGLYAYRIYGREVKKHPPQPKAAVKAPVKGEPPKMEVVKKPVTTPPVSENGVTNPDVFDQWANTLGLGEP